MRLSKINTIGIQQANKVMHMAACAYNLKKYLKVVITDLKVMAGVAEPFLAVSDAISLYFSTISKLQDFIFPKKQIKSILF